ncbi:uncharacterized protein [Cicer arietinum]|uniref:Uncharacterized protein LOC101503265 n=1 Tax=Cicer arietinum TaxID=3827 RepID=A0A1S2XM22_CICAR|nr:uncharacterized protein LOC101503265 [Cicer arietinum]XP_027187829.1 uncharacterized protein LOC101503265 [Cicer arietinum]
MADFEAPSFSLGLDFDDTPPPSPSTSPNHDPLPQVPDSDPDPETLPNPPLHILKRLRRGPPSSSKTDPPSCIDVDDDDIEEFSSQEDPVQGFAHSSVRNHSVCSSSKVSLKGVGVLTPHSFINSNEKKRKQDSDIPASVGLETGQRGFLLRKLAASPLRRFKLLDSDDDDDDDLVCEDVTWENKVGPSSSLGPLCNRSTPLISLEQDRKTQFDVNRNQDLWKDLSPVKNFSVPTPVFNEVFEEYFRSAKNVEVPKSRIDISENHNATYGGFNSGWQKDEQVWEAAGPLPPAHRYFFHEDPRIQQLVRSRLCNFTPLGVNRVNQQQNVSHIDYLGQFDNGGVSKTPVVRKGRASGSSSRRSKAKNLNVEQIFNASEGWVDPKIISPFSSGTSSRKKATKRSSTKSSVSKSKNGQSKLNPSNVSGNWVEPKSCTSMPRDAGKRRVQASSQSAGHWYTGSDGRKVYVNKSGQELTGRNAYRNYRKESGTGFKKSKKKTSAKKGN